MARILIVDDEAGLRVSLEAFLSRDGHEVWTAESVPEALAALERQGVDVIVSDIIMPGASGLDLLEAVRAREDGTEVILLTGQPRVDSAAEAVRRGAFDYLPKPVGRSAFLATVTRAARAKEQFDLNQLLAAENERYRNHLEDQVLQRTAELSAALRGTIGVVTRTLETRDPYTAGHQRGVARLARAMAERLGLPQRSQEGIEMAALVHDLGKIAIPADILARPTRLLEVEFAIVRDHPRVGYDILKDVDFPWPIAELIVQHHERLDGSGYPEGLTGDAIGPEARVLILADVVEAMLSHRPYRPAIDRAEVLAELERERGRLYDADAVDACLSLFRDEGFALSS